MSCPQRSFSVHPRGCYEFWILLSIIYSAHFVSGSTSNRPARVTSHTEKDRAVTTTHVGWLTRMMWLSGLKKWKMM